MDKNSESIYKRAVDTLFNDTNTSSTSTLTNFSISPTQTNFSSPTPASQFNPPAKFYFMLFGVIAVAVVISAILICVAHKQRATNNVSKIKEDSEDDNSARAMHQPGYGSTFS